MNLPETKARDYLKDVDPGALASFGLGAADMMSFGLGDQAARALESEAQLTQQSAQQQHPTAHLAGEIGGLLVPGLGQVGLAKAGVKVAPTAIGAAVRGIESRVGRAAAQTALRAVEGAGYAGAQVAGRTQGTLAERARAGIGAAPYGAAAGIALPFAISGVKAAFSPFVNRFLNNLAGEGPGKIAGSIAPAATGLLGTPEEIAVAKTLGLPVSAVRGRIGAQPMPLPHATPEPMDVPTFMRQSQKPVENAGLLAPTPQSAPMVAGNAAIPGRPDLGLLAPAGPYQTAGSPLRTVTPSAPMAGPLGSGPQIALQVQLARAMGMTEAAIAARLARLGITKAQLQAAFR